MSGVDYNVPGIYRELVRESPEVEFRTGTPAFLGLVHPGAVLPDEPPVLLRPDHLRERVDRPLDGGYLEAAVRGFFDNGGQRCRVLPIRAPTESLVELTNDDLHGPMVEALRELENVEEVDLLAFPDLMLPLKAGGSDAAAREAKWAEIIDAQAELVRHCHKTHHRMAILDAPPVMPGTLAAGLAEAQEYAAELREALRVRDPAMLHDAALYFPWLRPERGPGSGGFMPPSGHVAGVYARMDAMTGVHRAPAGVDVVGVCDLSVDVGDAEQGPLLEAGVNCLRAFRGRGIKIWGARTLDPSRDGRFVSVRRLIQTIGRWLEYRLVDVTMEPNDQLLWNRVARTVSGYLDELYAAGALRGRIAADAYYIKCDSETNPPEVRDAGMMVAEIGIAPLAPQEFITVRLVQRSEGLSLTEAAPG
ncbi:MAG: phage tail sheath family protein [Myxococcales bacterium]|nr:phage tail sheath family protein [Myxococcales bacterium]